MLRLSCCVGRLKELLITAGGENVPPVPIEDMVREELPCVSSAMLIGDQRKFLSVLLTLKSEVNLDNGAPLDKLSRPSREWYVHSSLHFHSFTPKREKYILVVYCYRIKEKCGVEVRTVSEAVKLASVEKALEAGLTAVNKRATSRAQCIQKFKVLPADFSIVGGELGNFHWPKWNCIGQGLSVSSCFCFIT